MSALLFPGVLFTLFLIFPSQPRAQTSGTPTTLTVKITSPSAGSTVSAAILVRANATPRSIRIRGVQFMLDGEILDELDTVPAYEIIWDTTGVSDGPHTLAAVALGLGDVVYPSAPVTVNVVNTPGPDITPPTVVITSPASGADVSGTVALSAAATDDTGVAGVQFLLDGSPLGDEVTAAPFSITWDTSLSSPGPRTLAARARDAAGNTSTSPDVAVTVTAPLSSSTRHEESAAALDPVAEWSSIGDAGAGATLSGGLAVFTATAGASATFAFNGTSVSWLGLPCEICGFARVTLDGVLQATLDTYAPTRPASSTAIYSARSLDPGNHTLVIEVEGNQNPASGGAYVLVDGFDVAGESGGGITSSGTRIEENAAEVTYLGTWYSMDRADASGGTLVEALDSAASATLAFDGTGVTFIGYKAPILGILSVTLDDVYQASIDTYAPDYEGQAEIFSVSGLAPGPHRLMIRPAGTYNPSSCCAYIVVDAFDVSGG